MNSIYHHEIKVGPEAMDLNGHANNVIYIQWLQDAAVAHARSSGCLAATEAAGALWVVRTHQIEYRLPVFAGDGIAVRTWVANYKKVRSLRRYELVRKGDGAVVAVAETDWVFVSAATGKPLSIPQEVKDTLPVVEPAP